MEDGIGLKECIDRIFLKQEKENLDDEEVIKIIIRTFTIILNGGFERRETTIGDEFFKLVRKLKFNSLDDDYESLQAIGKLLEPSDAEKIKQIYESWKETKRENDDEA